MRVTLDALAMLAARSPIGAALDRGGAFVLLVTLVLVAYGGVLGAWWHPIDDGVHLFALQEGRYPLPHFRPLHAAWNRALFACFGVDPFGWHAADLAVHAATTCALWTLLRKTGLAPVAALAGASAFAVWRAPLDAVAWVSAASGLLAVFGVVLCALCWWNALESSEARARRAWTVGSIVALLFAAGAKEDCVVAAPLLIGLHVLRDGWSGVLRRESLARYTPFAVVGCAYLAIAYDPAHWSDRVGVGEFEWRAALLPRLVRNVALLAWPRGADVVAHAGAWLAAGGALITGVAVFAWWTRARAPLASRATTLGLALVVAGLLPALPGPWESIAPTRMGYAATIGVAWVVAGGMQAFFARTVTERATTAGTRRAFVAATAAGALVVVHAFAVRSAIEWRFVQPGRDFRALVDDAFTATREDPDRPVTFLAPPLWNALDLTRTMQALALASGNDEVVERVTCPIAQVDECCARWSAEGRVLTRSAGAWVALELDDATRTALERNAAANVGHGYGAVVAGTRVR